MASQPSHSKKRLDQLLVERGLVETRSKAQALIMAGKVLMGTERMTKPGQPVPEDAELSVEGKEHPWVSRGGMKLAKALTHFEIDPAGMVAVDVGASTGGFTDVLLHHDAAKIYAVDVGHGQLDWKLRNDERVVVLEKTNARYLTAEQIPDPIDLIVCDASFISLKTVLPAVMGLATSPNARPLRSTEACERSCKHGAKHQKSASRGKTIQLIALIKPQFEAGKDQVGKGGVVRDPAVHEAVCESIRLWLTEEIGWQVVGITDSPITGPKGNVEFLVYATRASA